MEAKPGYDDVMACADSMARGNPLVRVESIGKSVEGRELPMVTITDGRADDADKQLVLVTCGTHGSEESGRAIGMALMGWLASGEPAVTLRNQKFVICPCVNPDGSVRNTHHNAEGVDIYRSYAGPGTPTSHEGRLVFDAVGGLDPALTMDVHGLAGGSMKEEIYVHPGFRNSPVNLLGPAIAREASDAAEAAGYPQAGPVRVDQPHSLPARMASLCNCLAYTPETTENFYPRPQMRASGLIRVKALIAVGDRRNFFHYYPGYPCEAVSGHPMFWLCAHGPTAEARGENRRQLLAALDHIPWLNRLPADEGGVATLSLPADRDLPGLPRFSLQLRIHKPGDIKSVSYDDRELTPDETDGFTITEDPASWIVRINVNQPLTQGDHHAKVRYDIQW